LLLFLYLSALDSVALEAIFIPHSLRTGLLRYGSNATTAAGQSKSATPDFGQSLAVQA
jgi:hypothetical protein